MAERMNQYVNTSLQSYFKSLAKYGYSKESTTRKLIVLIFLQEMLDGAFMTLMPEEDYRDIQRLLACMYGSDCLLPYPQYAVDVTLPMVNWQNMEIRIPEMIFTIDNTDRSLRKSTEEIVRQKV